MLYLGTLVTLFIFCGKDIARLATETVGIVMDCFANMILFAKRVFSGTPHRYKRIIKSAYRKFAVLAVVSVMPTCMVCIMGKGLIESASNSLIIIGAGLLVCGTVLLIGNVLQSERISSQHVYSTGKTPKHVTYIDALLMGLCQSVALLPGISCLILAYTMGLYRNFRKDFAMKYSLIMLTQVSLIKLISSLIRWDTDSVNAVSILAALVKLCGAIIVSFVFIRTIHLIIEKNRLKEFAYLCYGAGMVVIITHIAKVITV